MTRVYMRALGRVWVWVCVYARGVVSYRGAMSLRLATGQFRGECLYGLGVAAQFVVGLIGLRHLGDQRLYLTEHQCAVTSNINK